MDVAALYGFNTAEHSVRLGPPGGPKMAEWRDHARVLVIYHPATREQLMELFVTLVDIVPVLTRDIHTLKFCQFASGVDETVLGFARLMLPALATLEFIQCEVPVGAVFGTAWPSAMQTLRLHMCTFNAAAAFTATAKLRVRTLDLSHSPALARTLDRLDDLLHVATHQLVLNECRLDQAPHLLQDLVRWLRTSSFSRLERVHIHKNHLNERAKCDLADACIESRNALVVRGITGDSLMPYVSRHAYPPWRGGGQEGLQRCWAAKAEMLESGLHKCALGHLVRHWCTTQRPLPVPRDALDFRARKSLRHVTTTWFAQLHTREGLLWIKEKYRRLPDEMLRRIILLL